MQYSLYTHSVQALCDGHGRYALRWLASNAVACGHLVVKQPSDHLKLTSEHHCSQPILLKTSKHDADETEQHCDQCCDSHFALHVPD
jgi:hypothetical protein